MDKIDPIQSLQMGLEYEMNMAEIASYCSPSGKTN